MNSSATLFGEIFEITRGDLENSCFPYVKPAECPPRLGTDPSHPVVAVLETGRERRGSDLASKCRGLRRRIVWTELSVAVLSQRQTNGDSVLVRIRPQRSGQCLLGIPTAWQPSPTRDLPSTSSIIGSVESLRYGLVLTGTPSLKVEGDGRPTGDQLEKLCRGLFGHNWLYLVSSEPVEGTETTRSINELSEKVKDARATHLLKASPIDEENRTAQRYIELLEAKLKRFDRGRTSGMWRVRCGFYTDQATLLPIVRDTAFRLRFPGKTLCPIPSGCVRAAPKRVTIL